MSSNERLNAERLRQGLGDVVIGREIVVLEKTTSTNDVVWQMTRQGANEGLVVFAEHQTAGRGQRGRAWESAAAKGLWFSFLLGLKIGPKDSARLTAWAARAIATTINEQLSLEARVKPPNDVYIGSRKVAGVLAELKAQPHATHCCIIGIGLNVNQTELDFSETVRSGAVSLAMLRRETLDRHALAIALLKNLNRTYRETFPDRASI